MNFDSNYQSRMSTFLRLASPLLRKEKPKKIVISGPSGFLGSRVLKAILDIHQDRINHGLNPGEICLLSSSPGKLMEKLTLLLGKEKVIQTIYHHQYYR